jgi:hypothetical protein
MLPVSLERLLQAIIAPIPFVASPNMMPRIAIKLQKNNAMH